MAEAARKAVAETVALRSARFGNYDVPADRVVTFPEGLIGFADARRFALLEPARAESPFRHLVSFDRLDLGFVICDALALWPAYRADIPLPAGVAPEDLAVLAIITVPADPREMTANLMAPLVIDCRSRTGVQLVLDSGRYSTRHLLVVNP